MMESGLILDLKDIARGLNDVGFSSKNIRNFLYSIISDRLKRCYDYEKLNETNFGEVNVPVRTLSAVEKEANIRAVKLVANDVIGINRGCIFTNFYNLTIFAMNEDVDMQLEFVIELVKKNLEIKKIIEYGQIDKSSSLEVFLDYMKGISFEIENKKDNDCISKMKFFEAHYIIKEYFIDMKEVTTDNEKKRIVEAFRNLGCDIDFVKIIDDKLKKQLEKISARKAYLDSKKNRKRPVYREPSIEVSGRKKSPSVVKKITSGEYDLLKLINNDKNMMMPNKYLGLEEIVESVSLMIYYEWDYDSIYRFIRNCRKNADELGKARGVKLSTFDIITLEADKLAYYAKQSAELGKAYDELMNYYELCMLLMNSNNSFDIKLQSLEKECNDGKITKEEALQEYYRIHNDYLVSYEREAFRQEYFEYMNTLDRAYKEFVALIPKNLEKSYEVTIAKARALKRKEKN